MYTNPVPSRRIPYDIDGTEVGYWQNTSSSPVIADYNNGPTSWMTSVLKGLANGENRDIVIRSTKYRLNLCLWFFFPEERLVEGLAVALATTESSGEISFHGIQGSNDTTDGVNGTWETAALPSGSPLSPTNGGAVDWWRAALRPCVFSGPKRVIRCHTWSDGSSSRYGSLRGIHLYGRKAAGQSPDDIIVLDDMQANDPEFTTVKDFGDMMEGTAKTESMRLKNTSATKIANNINLQLNYAGLGISLNQAGPFGTVVDIVSLAPGATSDPIYINNQIGPPLQVLGPKSARSIITVGSWN